MAWEDPDAPKRMTIEDVKSQVSMFRVAEALGFDVNAQGKILSPFSEENTPSCHLYEDHFHDFSSGKNGDVVDFVQAVMNEDLAGAMVWLGKLIRFEGPEQVNVRAAADREVKTFTDAWKQMEHRWNPAAQAFVLERWGITADAVDTYSGLKVQGDTLYIPHWAEGDVVGIKIRRTNGEKTAVPGSTFTKKLYPAYAFGGNSVVITEGEPDAWVMAHMLVSGMGSNAPSVYALPSGASCWKDEWLETLEGRQIYICTDNDKAGRDVREKIERATNWNAKHVHVPDLYNDVADAYKAGWRWASRDLQRTDNRRPDDETHRECRVCKLDQPAVNFPRSGKKRADGTEALASRCKTCFNARRRAMRVPIQGVTRPLAWKG